MTDQTKAPETINLIILQADKDGQLTCLNHPIVRQFSPEYVLILAQALEDVAKGIRADSERRSKLLAETMRIKEELNS